MEGNTVTLRSSAPQWSLAGDKQLLDILNNIHQSLVTRCQEVNSKLDEMVSALDGASVDLQNVNNKFMALSNSQFIESRVYDDDVDVATQEIPKEAPKAVSPSSDVPRLRRSVARLVAAHEALEILASDSDDEEDEARVILRPRDMYSHRPLPHIIGSHAWRTKWHAGLHPEDSDSDSSMSKQDAEDEEYSDTDQEVARAPAMSHEIEESTASSDLPSEQDISSAATSSVKPSPSDIAAELARRLGGQHIQIPIQPEYASPEPVSRKVYRPEQPVPGTVFSDEPPPLDDYQSESSDSPEDVFAELHKNKPHSHSNREQSRMAEDLFAGLREYEEGDVFSDFKDTQSLTTAAKQKSTLFEEESEPELFAQKEASTPVPTQDAAKIDENIKKPIGGISLFGNKHGAESIGAAILRRNRRKSSSDDATEELTKKEVTIKEETPTRSQEKNIFDDLFAKSEKEQKNNTNKAVEKTKKVIDKPKPKIDLFSDNLFDDIDDIFTTNVTKNVKNDTINQKSLFDDDDDIFSDIAVTKTSDNKKVDSENDVSKNKSIFDSDDDLFLDNTVRKPAKKDAADDFRKNDELNKETKSHVFENEIDDIFTKSDTKNDNSVVNTGISINNANKKVLNNDKNSTKHNNNINNVINTNFENKNATNVMSTNNNNKSAAKSIFDDDDDENDELFSNTATKSSTSKPSTLSSSQTQSVTIKDQKSSLFDDDSDDNDLFSTKLPKNDKKSVNNNNTSKNYEIKTDPSQKSTIFEGLESDKIFVDTTQQFDVENKTYLSNDLIKNQSLLKEADTPVNSRKQSVFDDEEESLFGDSNKVAAQIKPKPELLKKPTIIPRNNNNGIKKQVNIRNTDPKDEFKQESSVKNKRDEFINQDKFTKDIEQKSNDNSTDKSEKELILSKTEEKLKAEKDNIKFSEESKPLLTEEHLAPIIKGKKPEFHEGSMESNQPQIEEKSAETIKPSKLDLKENKIEYGLPETVLEVPPPLESIDNNNDDDDIFADSANDSSTANDTMFHTPNVFDDIFTEPPAFEKSKEPKKSKNVNALFDDDSDDEALFFKKDEPVLDEKPDLSPDGNRDALFGIFHDEPPAIEYDFTQKLTKSNINDDFLKSDSEDNLFSTQRTIQTQKDTSDSSFDVDSKLPELDSNIETKSTIPTQIEESVAKVKKPEVSDQKPQIDKPKPNLKESHKDTTDGEPKKVGKLKSMNFNIDVSTLLPGASPKKKALEQSDTKSSEDIHKDEKDKKSLEQTDGQMFAKSSEDLHFKERIEPIMVKSVSFEGDPDSQVLDNKISKERAKIQVKRRPSTRRARQEAVKKSAIDFGEDSTDNSSSVDDPPKRRPKVKQIQTEIENNKEPQKTNETEDSLDDLNPEMEADIPNTDDTQTKFDTDSHIGRLSSDEIKSNVNLVIDSNQIDSVIKVGKGTDSFVPQSDNIFSDNIKDLQKENSKIELEPELKDIEPKYPAQVETISELKIDSPKTVTSKIVYILNDEDIFSNPVEKTETKCRTFDSDDDSLFKKEGDSSENIVVPNISTIGNAYKDTNNTENITKKDSKSNKKTLFDDLSDDDNELFNTNKKTTSKPKGILDSDSEEDLFGGRKRDSKATIGKKETKKVKKVEVKASLFGDEEDDDLFGANVKSNPATSSQPARPTREVVTTSEPVFDDPLSMLGDNNY